MFKKVTLMFIVLLFSVAMLAAQTMDLEPFGVSPRDASELTDDIFNQAYNGLLNVGVETQMYLKGTLMGASLSNPTWKVTGPAGSIAAITTTTDVDTSTQIAVFTPDVVGTYVVEFADGSNSATDTINAGTYVGIESGNCTPCHDNSDFGFKTTKWKETGHYSLFEDAMNGIASDHYAESCISCHTTGYDVNADNAGFDDRGFVYPDSADLVNNYGSLDGHLFVGVYDSLLKFYPDAMKLARIQCESCHGPGSAHFRVTSDSKMVSSLSSDICAWCHDSGSHHVYPEQWDVSRHANPHDPQTRSSCAPCHNGAGFVEYVKGGLSEDMPKNIAITCATCHEPHSDENEHQLRTVEATLENGEQVTTGGLGKLCMNCHKSRRDAIEYTNDYLDNLSSHYGPHHGPQADMLLGTNAVTFGYTLPKSAHFAAIENACVDCHMAPGYADEENNVILVGSHSFSVTDPDGVDNVAICEDCHGDVGTSFDEKKYYINGNADLDGNGVAEGLQIEVQGLLDSLKSLLPKNVDGEVEINDSTITLVEAQAGYNYFFVAEDRSLGIHNPAYTIALLKVSIEALGGFTGIDFDNNFVQPKEYSLSQNYPNPFNPTTQIKFSIPEATIVKITIYDALGREIQTLVDKQMNAGNYTVSWNATKYASGIYFYKMETNNFMEMKKMLLIK